MSGGSFNYFYSRDAPGDILENLNDLAEMVTMCRACHKEEALQLLNELYVDLKEIADRITRKHDELSKVMHDLEWWQSKDLSEAAFDKTVDEFLKSKIIIKKR